MNGGRYCSVLCQFKLCVVLGEVVDGFVDHRQCPVQFAMLFEYGVEY